MALLLVGCTYRVPLPVIREGEPRNIEYRQLEVDDFWGTPWGDCLAFTSTHLKFRPTEPPMAYEHNADGGVTARIDDGFEVYAIMDRAMSFWHVLKVIRAEREQPEYRRGRRAVPTGEKGAGKLSVLEHEQGHFALTEIAARLLTKNMMVLQGSGATETEASDALWKESNREYAKVREGLSSGHEKYDLESNIWNWIPDNQWEWSPHNQREWSPHNQSVWTEYFDKRLRMTDGNGVR